MKILAFHNYANHDAGAAVLFDDGSRLRHFSISDERLSRVKNSYFFPVRAIDECMGAFGIGSLREFDLVATDYSFRRRLTNTNYRYRKLEADYLKSKLDLDHRRIVYVDHHAAHAASAFYPSRFEEAAVLVVDGVGSEASTNSLYVGTRSGGLSLVARSYGTGIGLVYTLITRRVLGFGPGHEGKTMALAALGQPLTADRPLLDLDPRYDGIVTDFGSFVWRTPSADLRHELPRCTDPAELTGPYYARIAYDLQQETERCMLHLARWAFETTGLPSLCLAGGVALNCVANQRIVAEGPFREVFVQPAASDTGLPLGLALWAYHDHARGARRISFTNSFTGRSYERSETEALLLRFGIPFEPVTVDRVAGLLAEQKIVGWFVGGSELGPRALGHRSILADPRRVAMRDLLNAKVKHREMFRPFAPSVLAERAGDWFELPGDSPFMLLAPRVRPERKSEISAVVHFDGSARVHTVHALNDPLFHQLIVEFDRLTGVPMLLNTSFNDDGEPIAETPLDALICFLRTRIDYLYLDGMLITKETVPAGADVLAALIDFRAQELRARYRKAILRLCPEHRLGELRAFLAAYHPMYRYHSRLHTLVQLQDALGECEKGAIFTDQRHFEIIRQFLPEEYERVQERIVIVDDDRHSLNVIEDHSLVILFNLSLFLGDRPLRSFYEDRSLTMLQAPYEIDCPDASWEISNEYRSSNDWDAFYLHLLREDS